MVEMKDIFSVSGLLSQRIAPLDLLAWLQSGDRKNFTSVPWGSGFLIKWSFAYTLHQAWQSTIDEAKVLVLFVAGNDMAWWCIQVDLHEQECNDLKQSLSAINKFRRSLERR